MKFDLPDQQGVIKGVGWGIDLEKMRIFLAIICHPHVTGKRGRIDPEMSFVHFFLLQDTKAADFL